MDKIFSGGNRLICARAVQALFMLILFGGCWSCGGGGGGGGGGGPTTTVTGALLDVESGSPLVTQYAVTVSGNTVSYCGSGQVCPGNGTFTLLNVPVNATSITVTATGFITRTFSLPSLSATQTRDLGNVFLAESPNGAYNVSLTLTVVDVNTNAPIVGANVSLAGFVGATDSRGMITFNDLPADLGISNTPVGVVKASGYDDKPIILSAALAAGTSNQVTVEMAKISGTTPPPPSNISGTIQLNPVPPGGDLSGTTVNLLDKSTGNQVATTSTASDGSYGFWEPAGDYLVQAVRTGYVTQSQEVVLTSPDQTKTVNITLSQ